MRTFTARCATIRSARKLVLSGMCVSILAVSAFAQTNKPDKLQCESLTTPLGMDAEHPRLSWQLRDPRDGARQTAYQIQVASTSAMLSSGKADVWDSGRIESAETHDIVYAGPPLQSSKRYFWRVLAWDGDKRPYSANDATWWETGLLHQSAWQAKWIGYEEPELRSVRESGAQWITNPEVADFSPTTAPRHAFRFHVDLAKPVRRAILYATGQDTAAAWVNGKQVLEAQPLPPWKQMPWKTYASRNVTAELRNGQNLIAIEVVHYLNERRGPSTNLSVTPMNALLYIETNDGAVQLVKSGDEHWKSALDANGSWQQPDFDDSTWKAPVPFVPPASPFETGNPGHPWPTGAVKALRRTFDVHKPLASARLYATALGAYKFSLNGRRVGDQILSPGWTDYRERVIYQTYDVTSDLKPGKNAIGALLAPGWYSTPLQWFRQGYNYGDTPPALRAQLRIEYKDGSIDWIATDESWEAAISPILSAEIYDGETYDARKEQSGWDTASFADNSWKGVDIVQPHEPEIVWQYFQPIRAEKSLQAKAITNPAAGIYIFDFGQNLSGVPRIRVQGRAGTDVKLRFAEILNPDGTLYTENLRTAKATDHFILAGKGVEEYEPAFTFHGFRYMEISGVAAKPRAEDVQAVVFHTDAPFTASLKTGSAMLNQLWSNILWGQRSNFVGVPTDCPQRDERLGWSADAQVFWRAASYNMDLTAFSRKFSADLRGTQVGTPMYGIFAPGTLTQNPGYGTGWSDAGVIVPWTSWIQTGDKKVIEENWSGMEKYLVAIQEANTDFLWRKNYGIPFADWLSPEGVTPVDLIATAYWAYDVALMKQMAQATGKTADEQKYGELFKKIKAAFNQAFVRPDGFVGGVPPPPVFASGTAVKLSDKPVETQTGYVLALYMDLLPDSLRQTAAKRLIDRLEANHWRLGTGFLGTPYLLAALTDTGHADVAYRLLLNTEYPSWGYLIDHGATTMWERWNGDQMRNDPSMNSYNHYAYGAVADWIYRYAAGVDATPSDPGFRTILLHPTFDRRLGSLDFSYESAYGTVHSSWSISANKAIWKLTIPANATGSLPLSGDRKEAFTLDGKSLAQNSRLHSKGSNGQEVYEVPAGSYRFEVTLR
ncbi:MAG TPA: family 78 glycoside hydrolase catalytic domain [Candidatus Eisenbacteria bacterium]|nr:family 78 glycoside hydrolase catalytic domain [Candidatus Eisenbacteria bacterium]